MNPSLSRNLLRIKVVAGQLSKLPGPVGGGPPFVFVGGATVALYGDINLASDVRPTDDVDVVVELASFGSYARLSERLLELGFQPAVESSIICRYRVQGIVVDIMPTEPDILGFSNRWYPEGFRSSEQHQLPDGTPVWLFIPVYFLATKLEAHRHRGGQDLRFSTDFEDIVYILNNGFSIAERMHEGSPDVQAYLKEQVGQLLKDPNIEEGIYCQLEPRFATIRTERILQLLTNFIKS